MAVERPSIGECRQIVRFEYNEPTQLGAGKKDHYIELLTTRGKLRKINGNRSNSLGEAILGSQWSLQCRFQLNLSYYMGKSLKVLIDNMFFTIDKYELIDQKQWWYSFTLNEKQ